MAEKTLIEKLMEELQGKEIDELKKMASQGQEQLDREKKRFEAIQKGEILPTSPEEFKPISAEEIEDILKSAEQAVLIAGIVGDWRERTRIAEQAKQERERWLEEALVERIVRRATGYKGPLTGEKRRGGRDQSFRRPGWVEVDETCANCGKSVNLLPYQPDPGEPAYCSSCWRELVREFAKTKTKTAKSQTKTQ